MTKKASSKSSVAVVTGFGRQAITTAFFGPTNRRGSRIKATAQAGSVTVECDDGMNMDDNHAAAALKLAAKYNWSGRLVRGYLRDGSHVFVFLTD